MESAINFKQIENLETIGQVQKLEDDFHNLQELEE